MKHLAFPAFLTAVAMGLLHMAIFPVSAENLTYGDLTYTSDGSSVTITDCAADAVAVGIPTEIDGLPVTAIGDSAFEFCTQLTSVTMPDSITAIGSYAFYYCTALADVTLSDNLTDVGMYVFSNCESLTAISFPESTRLLRKGMFSGCSSLEAIHVDENNFWNKSVDGVLYGKIASVDGCDVDMVWLCCYPAAKQDTAFIIPEDVEQIEEYAFDDCKNLTSVTIPAGVWKLSDDAFFSCDALTEFNVAAGCTAASSRDGVLYDADGTRLLRYPAGRQAAEYLVPDGTAEIVSGAFSDAQYLESVQIPEGIPYIDQHVFSGCTSLKTLSLPQSIEYIGFYALYECSQLEEIRFAGTQEEWDTVIMNTRLYGYKEGNEILDNVTVSCAGSPAVLLGDLNADNAVDATDAAMLLVAAAAQGAGMESGLTDAQIAAADLNADGTFDAIDAAYILQYAAYAGAGGEMTLEEFLETLV